MADIFPPDANTPLGQLRYLIDDIEEPYAVSDARLQALLSVYKDNLQLAGADVFESIAVNEALLYRYVRTDDLVVDGSKTAEILLKRAARLREQASADAIEDAFEIVDYVHARTYPEAAARWL